MSYGKKRATAAPPTPFSQTPHRFNMFRKTYAPFAARSAELAISAAPEVVSPAAKRAREVVVRRVHGPGNAADLLFRSALAYTQRLVLAYCAPPLTDSASNIDARRNWAEMLATVELLHARVRGGDAATIVVEDAFGERSTLTIPEACAREWLLQLQPSPRILQRASSNHDNAVDGQPWSALAVRGLASLPWAHLVASSHLLQRALPHIDALRAYFEEESAKSRSRAEPLRFELLYRASRDGFKAMDFHKRCDNKGSTLTVVRSSCGAIFGGYANLSWQSNARGRFVTSNRSWLYALLPAPRKLPLAGEHDPAQNHPAEGLEAWPRSRALRWAGCSGPAFGNDLRIGAHANVGAHSLNAPFAYDGAPLTESESFTVVDYEVFAVHFH